MLLSEAVEQWILQRRIEGYSPRTLEAYRLQMDLLIRNIGDMPIDQVTLSHLRNYIGGPASEGRKPATIAHRVRMIRSFFNWAVEEDILTRSPAHKLREPKLPQCLPKALTFEELELLRDACQTPREHALIELLFATGCRVSELAGMQRRDVDWDRMAIRVIGKGNKEREVYFGARAALWLRRYLRERADAHPSLFIAERHPVRATTPHQIWYAMKRVADRAGLRNRVWPHVMRHTLATTLLNQGASLAAVQSILGHVRPETTQRYAYLSGAARQQEYQRYFIQ